MRYLCEACERLIEPQSVSMDPQGLRLVCPRCQASTRAALAAPALAAPGLAPAPPSEPLALPAPAQPLALAPAAGPVALPRFGALSTAAAVPQPLPESERCPKCAAPRGDRDDCAKCGLVFALYKPGADAVEARELARAREEFDLLLAGWGSPTGHLIIDRSGSNRLAQLARLSRHHLADHPTDVRAQAIVEAVAQRSMALAQSFKPTTDMGHGNLLRWGTVGFFALAALAVGFLLEMFHRSGAIR
jgi:hypothetical protein